MTRDFDTRSSAGRGWLTAVVCVVILGAGAALAYFLLVHAPGARTTPPPKTVARLVATTKARAAPAQLMIRAHGTVEAANSTALRARVSGQIDSLYQQLAPGTRFKKGQVLAHIDPSDYRLAEERAQNDLASAKAKLTTEKGQQAVAKRELKQVGMKNVSKRERHLALRGPQLAQANATVQSAQSSLKQARLDVKRTKVRAPYAGIVTERSASIGDVIATSTTIATLAATDAYWVNVSIPVSQLRWLHAKSAHDPGSTARIYYPQAWGPKQSMGAHVLRIQAALEKQGRMARVILTVAHPLGDNAPDDARLLLGAYVQARIRAHMPSGAVLINAAYLRENNHVWVMTADHKLAIRKVQVVYRDNTRAVVTGGLVPGSRIVTTDLSAPIAGRPLRTRAGAGSDKKAGSDESAASGSSTMHDAPRVEASTTPPTSPNNDSRRGRLQLEMAPAGGLEHMPTPRAKPAAPA